MATQTSSNSLKTSTYPHNHHQAIIPIKLVMIGAANAGKTSLVVRLVKDSFQPESLPTVGAMFLNKFFQFDGYTIKLEIWDTAGQEKFHSLAPMYFRGSKICLIVFDLSEKDSFVKAKLWAKEFKSHSTEPAIMALIGNKCDLPRATDALEIEEYIKGEGMYYFEASAKDNTNVNNIFQILADKVPPPSESTTSTNNNNGKNSVEVNGKTNKKKKCCG
ncbi:Rab GTPase [Tieghemostelium lacteum]|uniref:Rab GTPase n=1 Tax=Tieghemostelium lacteum TaxID=361077 RepID=A0A151Z488_TIELA|nr:Rab GTPase [Tieghemostelium lacteum]|eukprot:KYQ88761.1 Rab GTPase [Tieghemostelium lacteum]